MRRAPQPQPRWAASAASAKTPPPLVTHWGHRWRRCPPAAPPAGAAGARGRWGWAVGLCCPSPAPQKPGLSWPSRLQTPGERPPARGPLWRQGTPAGWEGATDGWGWGGGGMRQWGTATTSYTCGGTSRLHGVINCRQGTTGVGRGEEGCAGMSQPQPQRQCRKKHNVLGMAPSPPRCSELPHAATPGPQTQAQAA